jgi:hypothetical protein
VVPPEEVIDMSTAFKRWQDWAVIAIGIAIFATPFVFSETSNGNAAYTAYIMGALVGLGGLLAAFMATPSKMVEGVVLLLGVILFVAPWLFGFTAVAATSWVCWIAGLAVVGVSTIALLGEKPQRMVTT